MIRGARYVHTNLIARDWRKLATFYEEVFGCERLEPERDLSGDALDRGTALAGARLRGVHMRLPGSGPDGPTLELFQYGEDGEAASAPEAGSFHHPGFGHLAFGVDSVAEAREEVLARGGSPVGEVVRTVISTGRGVSWCYVRDPEGNVIELQDWE